jgi:hypothetical protein
VPLAYCARVSVCHNDGANNETYALYEAQAGEVDAGATEGADDQVAQLLLAAATGTLEDQSAQVLVLAGATGVDVEDPYFMSIAVHFWNSDVNIQSAQVEVHEAGRYEVVAVAHLLAVPHEPAVVVQETVEVVV